MRVEGGGSAGAGRICKSWLGLKKKECGVQYSFNFK